MKIQNGEKRIEDFESIPGWGVGFFQLFNLNSQKIKGIPLECLYPSFSNAGESDIMFLKRFHPDVRDVGKIDLNVIHLGPHGMFHNGRSNPRAEFLRGKTFFDIEDLSEFYKASS